MAERQRRWAPKVGHMVDRAGQRYGRLVALSSLHIEGQKVSWLCRCDCGQTTVAIAGNLATGHTKSCGCVKFEKVRRRPIVHGMTNTAEYRAWDNARARVRNPTSHRWKTYGGRGITMDERWLASFVEFYKDMGPKPSPLHSLDRINNDGPYAPGNCRWATDAEQRANRKYRRNWVTSA